MTATETRPLTTYRISTKGKGDEGPFHHEFEVNAYSYQDAANLAVLELNRDETRKTVAHYGNLSAIRTTGDHNKSGWFQGYYNDRSLNGLNSTGPAFHVM